MSNYDYLWLDAFIKTQLIEVIFGSLGLYLYYVHYCARSISLWRTALVIFSASSITHPLLWFYYPRLRREWGLSYDEYVFYGELTIFIIEALWYALILEVFRGRILIALRYSCLLNCLSYCIGLYLQ